ncbi:disulfide bond formation protein B [Mangrovibrevibacter kandeliae]|uniref:disulfide bond formation protein B n=1 Tax=Mangrovibrevibacter kandeliae TaxID=2968473 RepID=UPI002119B0E8|nr:MULTISPECIES: disulfide bond formation protein B [unclassified Aurantimonas]MCQ8783814.1 disulfide bond formation protein B [Aurantimonas sp. CSK15Z-1]MCW4116536.1 disulfide bond formation protein B [Aurantimonas sp. MSK8Z-1]
MVATFSQPVGRRQTLGSAVLLVGTLATVGTALLFEHIGGYLPCHLCLIERWPYYIAAPLALVTLVAAAGRASAPTVRGLLVLIALAMLVGLGLAIYHSGVEWHAWAGPSGCTGGGTANLGGDLLSTIDAVQPPACDEAAARFLGLSFAGWNAVASLVLAAVALWSAAVRGSRSFG